MQEVRARFLPDCWLLNIDCHTTGSWLIGWGLHNETWEDCREVFSPKILFSSPKFSFQIFPWLTAFQNGIWKKKLGVQFFLLQTFYFTLWLVFLSHCLWHTRVPCLLSFSSENNTVLLGHMWLLRVGRSHGHLDIHNFRLLANPPISSTMLQLHLSLWLILPSPEPLMSYLVVNQLTYC